MCDIVVFFVALFHGQMLCDRPMTVRMVSVGRPLVCCMGVSCGTRTNVNNSIIVFVPT